MAMNKLICPRCMNVHFTENDSQKNCPTCNLDHHHVYNFRNSDEFLEKEIPRVLEERDEFGLQGLVGGLSFVIINVEPENFPQAVEDYLKYTGFEHTDGFEDDKYKTCVLESIGSPAILIRLRKSEKNPFSSFNTAPKARHLPNSRLETFVFTTPNMAKYSSIQKSRGVNFLEEETVETDSMIFMQTIPSLYHGSSIGYVQWKGDSGSFRTKNCSSLKREFKKPSSKFLKNIFELDHTATRIHAEDRDKAIIEFMELTNYNFAMAIYVKDFNSITSVARLSEKDFAMVFTSGILPDNAQENVGPTELFIRNYGTRVHHLAFRTAEIDATFQELGNEGMGFLLGLIGSPEEGLKQTFSNGSVHTLLVNEYIQRFGGFDGFFTASNVTLLTESTAGQ